MALNVHDPDALRDALSPNQTRPPAQYVVTLAPKSMAMAIVLTLFFGPLGLLYAAPVGALVMFLGGLFICAVTFGMGIVLVWFGCIIWAVIAVGNHNDAITRKMAGM